MTFERSPLFGSRAPGFEDTSVADFRGQRVLYVVALLFILARLEQFAGPQLISDNAYLDFARALELFYEPRTRPVFAPSRIA